MTVEVLDISRDKDTDEITQFLTLEGGEPETKVASPENMLLYDPEDQLPFEGGLYQFIDGETALQLSEDPRIVVGQASNEYSYIISIDNRVVETTPNQAHDALQGVYDALALGDLSTIKSVHKNIIKNQVRRNVINPLSRTFEARNRIEMTANGWLVDDFYLVDWNAKMYAANDDPEEGDYVREQGNAVKKDTSYEFVRIRHGITGDEDVTVTIGGEDFELTEREILFLAKVKWLLNRRHYHPDMAFWRYADRWADVDVETGKPEVEDEPNLDQFDI